MPIIKNMHLINLHFSTYLSISSSVATVVSCYCFITVAAVTVLGRGGIVSIVYSIVLSKGCKPFTGDLTRAASSPSIRAEDPFDTSRNDRQ